MRLLDLFCGAGGCAVGYHRAGFSEIVGVDNRPMPRYPFEFVQADALEYVAEHGHKFDVIHASPPCQAYTSMRALGKTAGAHAPDLVSIVRESLARTGKAWVIENVPGAPLRMATMLCGSSFGLAVRRHRWFESSNLLFGRPCQHTPTPTPTPVFGDGRPTRREARRARAVAVYGDHPQSPGDKTYRVNRARTLAEGQEAMGIDWMEWKELTQAIPPAYTEYIGRQLLRSLS